MNIINRYAFLALLAAGLCSCTSEDFWATFDHTVDGTIELSAGITSSTVERTAATRGDDTSSPQSTPTIKAMQEGTLIHLKVEGYWNRKNPSLVSPNTIYKAEASNTDANSLVFAGTEPMEPLYWDDFGVGDPANKDNKEKGLTIYGVAVNGVTDASKIEVSDWNSLKWELATDGEDVLSKDILVSNNISGDNTYKFDDRDNPAEMSFSHPLSMITFNINAGDGFPSGFKNDPILTLSDDVGNGYSYVDGTVDIISGTATKKDGVKVLTAGTTSNTTDNKKYVMQALVYPETQLGVSDDAVIAVLEADGNIYYIKAGAIRTAMHDKDSGTDYKTKAGFNYEITITVKKQSVSVIASVEPWDTISTTADAKVQFTTDVATTGSTTGLGNGDKFSLWMTKDDPTGERTALVTYDDSKLTCDPILYWPNGNDSFKFRALAKKETSDIVAETNTTVSQGTDLLWGTTADNNGAAVSPRTGSVPLTFMHAMSNVSFVLQTTADASAVELSGASVKIVKLNTKGEIDLTSGKITPSDKEEVSLGKIDATSKSCSRIMIPQDIDNNVKLVITLNDGDTTTDPVKQPTTYSLQLNGGSDITWESGNAYTYTITLKKEDVKFSVKVEDWKPNTGSGNATLDWD